MRKFLTIISYTVLPVWLALVGLATYLWVTNDKSGDLMRLGLIDGGAEYTDSIFELALPEVYYTGQENDSLLRLDTCGVVVVGDSFSHGGGVGKTGDYVNYLAHESGRKVVVYTPPKDPTLDSPMQVAYDLLNLGVIDSTNCRNLVVQEVERYLVDRHCRFVTTHTSLPRPEAEDAGEAAEEEKRQDYSPLLRVKDYIFYRFLGANPIYTAALNQPLFGGEEPSKLYFYNDDVNLGINVTDGQQRLIVSCFEDVIEAARRQGVNLVILIAADKYDMYQDFITGENPYPAKTLNEDIAQWMPVEGKQCLLFSKDVLHPLVERGVKDVYLYNDTHWSPASSHLISQAIIERLR